MTVGRKPTQYAQPALGIAILSLGIAIMTAQDAVLKWIANDYGVMQILLVRSGAVVLVASLVLAGENRRNGLRTARPFEHAARSACNVVTISLFIVALSRLPLAEVMAIVMASPLFTLALSALILRERVGLRRWSACLIGFLGVLIMLRPGSAGFSFGGLAALGASLCYSLMIILTRRMTSTEGTGIMMLYSALGVLLVSSLLAPTNWLPLQTGDAVMMLGAGFLVGLGHYCFVQGYRFASPTVLAPFDYTALLWGLLLGWLIWNDVPDALTLVGASIVVSSGLFIIYRETRS